MKTLLLKLEPLIWFMFGQGILIGTILLTGWILVFDATGIIYLLVGFVAIRMIRALADGPDAWQAAMQSLENPMYIGFHVLSLISVIFVAVRFFRLFPKAQPPSIGPLKPPPGPVIHAALYVVWIGVTAVMSLALAGVIF